MGRDDAERESRVCARVRLARRLASVAAASVGCAIRPSPQRRPPRRFQDGGLRRRVEPATRGRGSDGYDRRPGAGAESHALMGPLVFLTLLVLSLPPALDSLALAQAGEGG